MLISDFMMSMLITEREPPPISQQEQGFLLELQHPHHQVMVQILCTDWKTIFFFLNQTVIAVVVELLHPLWGGSWGLPCRLCRGGKGIIAIQKAELVMSVSFLGDILQLAVVD